MRPGLVLKLVSYGDLTNREDADDINSGCTPRPELLTVDC
jgi:hypothetical protein